MSRKGNPGCITFIFHLIMWALIGPFYLMWLLFRALLKFLFGRQ